MLLGVVGKPNTGKSTFFKAATLAETEIANYPFATIKPHHGVGFVRLPCADTFFGVQCQPRIGYCQDHQRFVAIDLLDVAGLVPGAHEGAGMGNQFLNDLNQADALLHIIDAAGATNEKGEQVPPGSYDPAADVRFLEDELDYWYLGILKKGWDRLARQIMQEKLAQARVIGKQMSGLGVTEEMVKALLDRLSLPEDVTKWSDAHMMLLARDLRRQTKPMLIVANKADIPCALENVERLRREFPAVRFIPASAESELALHEASKHGLITYLPGDADFTVAAPEKLTEAQTKALEFIRSNVLKNLGNTGVQQALNYAIFDLLKYIAVFPGGINKLTDQYGRVLPDCFLLKAGSTAHQFAYAVHSDFGDKFIRAIDVKTKRTVGKEHVLNHLDVMEIVANK